MYIFGKGMYNILISQIFLTLKINLVVSDLIYIFTYKIIKL